MRRAKAPHPSGGLSRPTSVVPAVMWSIQLCGVGPQNPCHITLLAEFTPHNSRAGPIRGMAARHAVCLAGSPVPARSPCGPARCGLGRPRIPLVRSCRLPVGRLGLVPREAPEQRLAKRAKDLDLAMDPVLTASPPRMSASVAKRTPGRPGHRVGEESNDRHGRRARRTRADAAPPEPPSCSLRGRCGNDQVGARAVGLGPAGGSGAVDLETERAAVRQAGTPAA